MKRRQFIVKASSVFAGVNFLPGHAWAESPNGKLNLIHIGVGGMGGSDRGEVAHRPQLSEGGVKSALLRGKQRLRQCIERRLG